MRAEALLHLCSVWFHCPLSFLTALASLIFFQFLEDNIFILFFRPFKHAFSLRLFLRPFTPFTYEFLFNPLLSIQTLLPPRRSLLVPTAHITVAFLSIHLKIYVSPVIYSLGAIDFLTAVLRTANK